MPPVDVSDSFLSATALPDLSRPEPPLPSLFPAEGVGESPRSIALLPAEKRERTRNAPAMPFGIVGSLALHLLPLLLLVSWASDIPDIPETIPVQLIIETPPPAPAAPQPPPRGRLASDDMGPTADPTPKTATPAPERAPELKTALASPESPPEPLPQPDTALEPPPPPKPKPAPRPAIHRPDTALRLMGPSGWQVLGEAATRDEYLAMLKVLTQRHMNLLPPSLIAGRRGDTYLTVHILSDGTIARIAIARGSGYPDIDERVERMVAAVGRFPPLPTQFQEARMEVIMHLRFPEGTER